MRSYGKLAYLAVCLSLAIVLMLPVRLIGNGDDDPQTDGFVPEVALASGFYAWVREREQIRDGHLIENVQVLIYPTDSKWPGVYFSNIGVNKEVVSRVDIELGGIHTPSRFPNVQRQRSHYTREVQRGKETVEFLRNTIFAYNGDLFLKNVKATEYSTFEADVYIISENGSLISLADALESFGHGSEDKVRNWGARRLRTEPKED